MSNITSGNLLQSFKQIQALLSQLHVQAQYWQDTSDIEQLIVEARRSLEDASQQILKQKK